MKSKRKLSNYTSLNRELTSRPIFWTKNIRILRTWRKRCKLCWPTTVRPLRDQFQPFQGCPLSRRTHWSSFIERLWLWRTGTLTKCTCLKFFRERRRMSMRQIITSRSTRWPWGTLTRETHSTTLCLLHKCWTTCSRVTTVEARQGHRQLRIIKILMGFKHFCRVWWSTRTRSWYWISRGSKASIKVYLLEKSQLKKKYLSMLKRRGRLDWSEFRHA